MFTDIRVSYNADLVIGIEIVIGTIRIASPLIRVSIHIALILANGFFGCPHARCALNMFNETNLSIPFQIFISRQLQSQALPEQ